MGKKPLGLTGVDLVPWWAETKARDLRLSAKKAREHFTRDPLAAACREYADVLDECATRITAWAEAKKAALATAASEERRP